MKASLELLGIQSDSGDDFEDLLYLCEWRR